MNPLTNLLSRFKDLTVRQQVTLVGGVLLIVIVGFFMMKIATRTPFATVTTGIEPADAGKVSQALSEAGIENRISQGGTAIQVPEPQLDAARATVATADVSTSGGQVGFELFDKSNLGATDFQQRIQYQRALEGEIARTIQHIEGVRSAQVQLVLPRDQLFTEEGSSATASVLLQTEGVGLNSAQVQGVAKLVQSSVEGLKAENVTITDQSGGLLWPTAKVANPSGQTATDQQQAEERMAQNMSSRLNTLLVQTLGPGKAQAQVTADLNVNKETRESLRYGPNDGKVLTEKTGKERLRGAGKVSGQAGTDGNIPTYGVSGSGSDTRYDNDTADRTYGVDKTVTKTQVAPGQIQKLQVAVLLDRSVSAADETSLRQTLSAAAGVDTRRGDQLAVSRVTFTKAETAEEKASPLASVQGIAKWIVLGIGLIAFTFLAWRGLRRREDEALGSEPKWLDELSAELTPKPAPKPAAPRLPERQKLPAQGQVEQLADKEPEQMAHQLRSWMNED